MSAIAQRYFARVLAPESMIGGQKITLNMAALHRAADLFKQMGEAAEAVGKAADTLKQAAERAESINTATRSWRGASFASLLERIFRR